MELNRDNRAYNNATFYPTDSKPVVPEGVEGRVKFVAYREVEGMVEAAKNIKEGGGTTALETKASAFMGRGEEVMAAFDVVMISMDSRLDYEEIYDGDRAKDVKDFFLAADEILPKRNRFHLSKRLVVKTKVKRGEGLEDVYDFIRGLPLDLHLIDCEPGWEGKERAEKRGAVVMTRADDEGAGLKECCSPDRAYVDGSGSSRLPCCLREGNQWFPWNAKAEEIERDLSRPVDIRGAGKRLEREILNICKMCPLSVRTGKIGYALRRLGDHHDL